MAMEPTKYIIVLLTALCANIASPVKAIETTDSSILTTDTTAARKKGAKLFDRGLTNYVLIPQKEWICGLTASYMGYNSDDSDIALIIKDFNFIGSMFGIHPFVGYFIKDNQCIGIKLGYSSTSADLNNFKLDIMEDLDISLSNLAYSAQYYSAGIFYRTYVGISPNGQFGVFNKTSLTFTSGTSLFAKGPNENRSETKTLSTEISLGLSPGISVFIFDNISANVSVGILGLNYKQSKQFTDNVETGSFKSSGANFKINILNINIGITVHI